MNAVLVLAQGAPQGFFEKRTGAGCVAENGFCPSWIADNINRYWTPLLQHAVLTIVAVTIGFAIAFVLAIVAHRQRWLTGPITAFTGALYTIPSAAAFVLLISITGRGNVTAEIALVSYTLLILFRNITTGLRNVPDDVIDAARGMGLTSNQILRRIELPLATPEILAGLRIAFTTTVGLATLAFLGGGDGLGTFFNDPQGFRFKSNVVLAGGLAVLLAAAGDLIFLSIQRFALPWRRVAAT